MEPERRLFCAIRELGLTPSGRSAGNPYNSLLHIEMRIIIIYVNIDKLLK